MTDCPSESPGLSRTAASLTDAMRRVPRVCPVCTVVADGVRGAIDALFYEHVNDVPTRAAIRQAGGFCREHARQISLHADTLGTAIIMRDILAHGLKKIENGAFDTPPGVAGTLGRLLDRSRNPVDRAICPICSIQRNLEERVVDDLLQTLAFPPFAVAFAASAGLCIPHFHLAYTICRDVDAWKIVLDTETRTLRELSSQLAEATRKHDYRYRNEGEGEEADAWKRGLDISSGWVHR